MAPGAGIADRRRVTRRKVMSIRRLMIASIATLALSLPGYTTLAEPSATTDAVPAGQSLAAGHESDLTLVRSPGGGRSSGGVSRGFSGGARGFSRGHSGGARSFSRAPAGRSFMYQRPGSRAIMRNYGGRRVIGHHHRHRRFVNGAWVWVWDDWGYGGSCYTNCREAGYGPRYCSVYADNFC
jgi:hypothetical protein